MVSIIFPVFNEETRLKMGLEKTIEYLLRQKYPYEIIVVNDGSLDSTREILTNFEKGANFRVLDHEVNLGKGAAIRTGMMAAKGDLILFSDIDLSVPIETLEKFIAKINDDYDIVIGSRRTTESKILTHQNFARELMGQIFTTLSNLILGIKFSDFTCGFKLFTRKAAKKVFSQQKINGWVFDSEVLFLAKKQGFKICEVGVEWSDVKFSKVRFPRDIILSFLELLKITFPLH